MREGKENKSILAKSKKGRSNMAPKKLGGLQRGKKGKKPPLRGGEREGGVLRPVTRIKKKKKAFA